MNTRISFRILGTACALMCFGLEAAYSQSPMVKLSNIAVPSAVAQSALMGQTDPTKVINVAVSLPYGDPVGMQAFVDSVSDPGSTNFRHFIGPADVGTRFGLSSDKLQAVVSYLMVQGFKVKLISKSHLAILAQCTVKQAENAFATQIDNFKSLNINEDENKNFYSFTTAPSVPANIAPYILSISGLQNYTKAHPRVLTPNQERTLYGLTPLFIKGFTGAGRTIGISNWDGFQLSNVPLFTTKYGLPVPGGGVGTNITVVTVDGGSQFSGAQGEGDLDIQMVLSSSPLCHLLIYDGGITDSSSIPVLTQEADDNLVDICSESYGWNLSGSDAMSAHDLHLQMNAEGITYMAATGDSGTAGLAGKYQYSDYEPEVLLVGGSVPTTDVNGNRISEAGWSLGGGGWTLNTATFNTRPSWQKGSGVLSVNKRLSPDVAEAAAGSGNTGAVFIYYQGQLSQFDGTSVASPLFAGQLGSAEQNEIAKGGLPPDPLGKRRIGRIQDIIYRQGSDPKVFFDIKSGANGTLPDGSASAAHAGWDTVSGWGAINWQNMDLATSITLPLSPTLVGVIEGGGLDGWSWVNSLDGQFFRMGPSTITGGQAASAAFKFDLPPTVPRSELQEIDVILDSRFATGSTGQVYLLNFTTGKWDILKSFALGTSVTPMTASLKANFNTYVSAAGEYRVLIRGLMPSSIGVTGNSFDIDYLSSNSIYLTG